MTMTQMPNPPGADGERELQQIHERYARRHSIVNLYSRLNPEVLAWTQERQRVMVQLLRSAGVQSLADCDVIEIGCGAGANLQEMLLLGAQPQRLVGNELLDERLQMARRNLPTDVRLMAGDASALPIADASFDIVMQSTVFTSILDDALKRRVADQMWRWLRPGGFILWYDFVYDNPSNPDVKGVPLSQVRSLFPQGQLTYRRVTLAPPIARRVTRVHPGLFHLFNAVPLLRSHVFCLIAKS